MKLSSDENLIRAPAEATAHDRLLARLEATTELSERDRAAVRELPIKVRDHAAGADLVCEGEVTRESLVLIDGFLQRYKLLSDGRRQVLAFHLPGDIPDLQSLYLPRMDHSLSAVVDSRVGAVPHAALQRMISENTGLAAALWREALIDGAKFREWIANIGGRAAFARTAHLLCELYVRTKSVGLDQAGGFLMPLTQLQMGEALGMSAVHVNRMMSDLRRRGLIIADGRHIRILDWAGLREVAAFDPAYLHMRAGEA